MNGKRIDNSSFLKGATKGKPGKILTRWQKKPHIRRAMIRGAVFWPIVGIIALALYNGMLALFVLAFSAVPLGILAFRRGRFLFFDPFTSTDAANGDRTQHWILKNKYRALLHMQPRPGYITKKERKTTEFPPDVERAIRDSINAGEKGTGAMPVLRVTRYRRSSGK